MRRVMLLRILLLACLGGFFSNREIYSKKPPANKRGSLLCIVVY